MKTLRLLALLLAAACIIGAAAGQDQKSAASERQQEDRSNEEPCPPAAQRYKSAEESLRRAKTEGASAKMIERKSKEVERARREYCKCASDTLGKAPRPMPEDLDNLCNPKSTPINSTDGGSANSGDNSSPTPTPQPDGDRCGSEAGAYEKTWMRYSENVQSKPLQQQVLSAKSKLCGCLTRHYGYEGVLPQPLRSFCEDRTILTPPYFPSRGETPRTVAP